MMSIPSLTHIISISVISASLSISEITFLLQAFINILSSASIINFLSCSVLHTDFNDLFENVVFEIELLLLNL